MQQHPFGEGGVRGVASYFGVRQHPYPFGEGRREEEGRQPIITPSDYW